MIKKAVRAKDEKVLYCPLCAEEFTIDEREISPSAADPEEWKWQAVAEMCPNNHSEVKHDEDKDE